MKAVFCYTYMASILLRVSINIQFFFLFTMHAHLSWSWIKSPIQFLYRKIKRWIFFFPPAEKTKSAKFSNRKDEIIKATSKSSWAWCKLLRSGYVCTVRATRKVTRLSPNFDQNRTNYNHAWPEGNVRNLKKVRIFFF